MRGQAQVKRGKGERPRPTTSGDRAHIPRPPERFGREFPLRFRPICGHSCVRLFTNAPIILEKEHIFVRRCPWLFVPVYWTDIGHNARMPETPECRATSVMPSYPVVRLEAG